MITYIYIKYIIRRRSYSSSRKICSPFYARRRCTPGRWNRRICHSIFRSLSPSSRPSVHCLSWSDPRSSCLRSSSSPIFVGTFCTHSDCPGMTYPISVAISPCCFEKIFINFSCRISNAENPIGLTALKWRWPILTVWELVASEDSSCLFS